jgi:metal-sulfur cluster biosynthetic enzyme
VEAGGRVGLGASAEAILEALRAVEDPEAAMSIVDLGLVYAVECEAQEVRVDMTLTSPSCPLGPYMVDEVTAAIRAAVPGVPDVQVNLVWDPPWTPERMSEEARTRFGWSP